MDARQVGVVVLAAGHGSRFEGGLKLLAPLHGSPILQHVLDAVSVVGPARTVAVLGHEADVVERTIAWRGQLRVRNPDPTRGLSSSLRLGIRALWDADDLAAAVVVLGDQPMLEHRTIASLLRAAEATGAPLLVPRYADGSNPNPVLIRREAWPLLDELVGDRGLAPIIRARPALVHEVAIDTVNPDVDTVADLERLARERG